MSTASRLETFSHGMKTRHSHKLGDNRTSARKMRTLDDIVDD